MRGRAAPLESRRAARPALRALVSVHHPARHRTGHAGIASCSSALAHAAAAHTARPLHSPHVGYQASLGAAHASTRGTAASLEGVLRAKAAAVGAAAREPPHCAHCAPVMHAWSHTTQSLARTLARYVPRVAPPV